MMFQKNQRILLILIFALESMIGLNGCTKSSQLLSTQNQLGIENPIVGGGESKSGTISGGGGYLEEWGTKFLARIGSDLAMTIRNAPVSLFNKYSIQGFTPEMLAKVVESALPLFNVKKDRDGRVLQMDYDRENLTIMALYEFFVIYGDKNPDFPYKHEDVQGLSNKLLHEASHLWGFSEEEAARFAENYLHDLNQDLVLCSFKPDNSVILSSERDGMELPKQRHFSVVAHLSFPSGISSENPSSSQFKNFSFVVGTSTEFDEGLKGKIEKIFQKGLDESATRLRKTESPWGLRFNRFKDDTEVPIEHFILNFDGTAHLVLASGYSPVTQDGKCQFHFTRSYPRGQTVTYRSHIAAILKNSCVECHQNKLLNLPGLTAYSEVKALKDAIKDSVASRRMPPGPVADGSCQNWKNSRALSQEQILDLKTWVDAGALEGDPYIPTPKVPEQLHLASEANTQMKLDLSYTAKRNHGTRDVRCFSTDLSITALQPFLITSPNAILTAYEFSPGNLEVTEKISFWATVKSNSETAPLIQAKESIDSEPGWDCYQGVRGTEIGDLILLGSWTPRGGDLGVIRYPNLPNGQSGVQFPLDTRIIMEIHYDLRKVSTATDSGSTLFVRLEDPSFGLIPGGWIKVSNKSFVLPPQQNPIDLQSTLSLGQFLGIPPGSPEGTGKIHGVAPNMHQLGRKLKVSQFPVSNPLSESCLVDFENWNGQSDAVHFYESSIPISTYDVFSLKCSYDTSQRSSPTPYGLGVEDEECEALFYSTAN